MLFSCFLVVILYFLYDLLYFSLYNTGCSISAVYYMFTIHLLYCITFYKHRFIFYLLINYLFFRQRIFNYSVFGGVFFWGGRVRHFSHMPPAAALGLVTPLHISSTPTFYNSICTQRKFIILTIPSPINLFKNLPDCGRHMTSPYQVLFPADRRERIK